MTETTEYFARKIGHRLTKLTIQDEVNDEVEGKVDLLQQCNIDIELFSSLHHLIGLSKLL